MHIEVPTDEELAQFITEFEETNDFAFPENIELTKVEFAQVVLSALQRFFDEFPEEGYRPLSHYTENGKEIQNPSQVLLVPDETDFPYLNVKAYRDDGSWIFNGYVNFDRSTGYFWAISYRFLAAARKAGESMTDEEFKERLAEYTLRVLRMAMRRLPKWIEILTDSFESKIELIWSKQVYENFKEDHSLNGLHFPSIDFSAQREKSFRAVESKLREFVQDDTGFEKYLLKMKKKRMAIVYQSVFPHWELMHQMQLAGKNWRRYILAGDMSDITEDLIEDFEADKNAGDIALEHAARRAELLNTGNLTEANRRRRENGILCSGYSRSKLFQFKKQGEALLAVEDSESTLELQRVD